MFGFLIGQPVDYEMVAVVDHLLSTDYYYYYFKIALAATHNKNNLVIYQKVTELNISVLSAWTAEASVTFNRLWLLYILHCITQLAS